VNRGRDLIRKDRNGGGGGGLRKKGKGKDLKIGEVQYMYVGSVDREQTLNGLCSSKTKYHFSTEEIENISNKRGFIFILYITCRP
jgi:opacity protein-like surface antigen